MLVKLLENHGHAIDLRQGNRFPENRVGDAEDGRVDANSHGQSEGGDHRKARILPQHAERVAYVLQQGRHPWAYRLLTPNGSGRFPSLSKITPTSATHISSLVRSPQPTGTMGLLGFLGLPAELSKTDVTSKADPEGIG